MKPTRGLLLAVYLPTLLLSIGQGILVPTIPLYAQSFGVSFGLVSLAVAALGFGTLVADVPIGMLLERLGRRPMMLMGAGGFAAATLGLGLARSFPELIVYQAFAGVATAMWGLSRMAYVTDTVPLADRGRALATFGGFNRIGVFLGPAIGGLVGSQFGLAASCLAAAAVATTSTVLAFAFTTESRHGDAAKTAHLRWRVIAGLLQTHRRDLVSAGTAQLGAQMIRAGRQVVVPLFAASVLGLDIAAVGGIVSLSWAIEVALFVPAGMIMDRFGRKYASVPSFAVLALGMALVPLAHSTIGLIGAVAVMGLGNGLGSGSMMTLGADLAPRGATGEFLGLWRLIGDVGQTSGPLVVGTVADLVGLGLAALVLSGIGIFAAVTLALFVNETLVTRRTVAPNTG